MNYNRRMKLIGKTLKRTRVERKATQQQVADVLGVSQEVLSMIEDGRRAPGDDLLGKINDWIAKGGVKGKAKRGAYQK